jgi:hypothetical protein
MKLPDNEILDDETYWLIKDTWKLDWEKGVQVPVKPELSTISCKIIKTSDDDNKTIKTVSAQHQKLLNKQILYKL